MNPVSHNSPNTVNRDVQHEDVTPIALRPIALQTLRRYGGAAKSALPELKAVEAVERAQAEQALRKLSAQAARQERERQKQGVAAKPKTPRELRREAELGALANQLKEVIATIENDRNPPTLIRVTKPL